jgi:hypothetical protein
MPPWYPLVAIQSKLANKLPYQKFQYPTYTKDTNLNAHIKLFTQKIRINGETVEVDIINLFGFILQYNILEWGKKLYNIILVALYKI